MNDLAYEDRVLVIFQLTSISCNDPNATAYNIFCDLIS